MPSGFDDTVTDFDELRRDELEKQDLKARERILLEKRERVSLSQKEFNELNRIQTDLRYHRKYNQGS